MMSRTKKNQLDLTMMSDGGRLARRASQMLRNASQLTECDECHELYNPHDLKAVWKHIGCDMEADS